jgi:hypothetical protein
VKRFGIPNTKPYLGFLQPVKNVEFSSSSRATEPQVPEGMVKVSFEAI